MSVLEGKTILLTGSNGFIGSHLAEFLHKIQNVKLIFMSRKPLQQHYSNVVHIEEDLADLSAGLWAKKNISHIDIVFHLAAFIPKKSSDVDVDKIYAANLIGTKVLLESLPNIPEKIVFSSSVDVYAPQPDGEKISEESNLGCTGLYGLSKLFCEQLILEYARNNKCGCALLRYGHIYGPGEDEYSKLIPLTILNLLRNKLPVIYGDGSAKRDFLYIKDAVIATIKAAESGASIIGPVNIVSGNSVSIKEVIECLMTIAERDINLCEHITDDNQRSLVFDNSKMQQEIGEWTNMPFFEGLKEEYRVMKVKYG